jgi:trans-aconitate 3-methyltransferase
MSDQNPTTTNSSLPTTEHVFSKFNADQGKAYVQARPDYHPYVYETIINKHKSTGGQLDTILDIGCGPGFAVRALAPHFQHAIGLDPSEGMIATARSTSSGVVTASNQPIRFEISTAESLGQNLSPVVPDASVDLITASNAAHWFDMPGFYTAAARILKPGGNIAFWGTGEVRVHPSMPAAEAIQEAMDRHNEDNLRPYATAGNLISRSRYTTLPLPWTLDQPNDAFRQDNFWRKDWEIDEPFLVMPKTVSLDMLEVIMSSGSALVRWREANPDKAGTEKDILRILRRNIERLQQEAGVKPGEERLMGAIQGFLLFIKKT